MGKRIKRKRLYISLFWALFSLPFAVLAVLFILLYQGKLGYVPTFEELENPENNLASEVYSEDSVLLGKFYYENRTYVDFEDLSENVVNALLATEDIRFHRHSGIDARGLARVLFRTILLGQRRSGGGSTITQQLAKNLYPRDTVYYQWKITRLLNLAVAKFKEWNTAVKLERNYAKNEIMVMYMNTVSFGGQAYGIKSAARTFFDKSPDSLKVEEAATLIGLLRAPSYYNPGRHPERSRLRRNIVLSQMNKYGFITDRTYDSLSILPIELRYKVQSHNVGLATYFREYLRVIMGAEKPDPGNYFLYRQYQEDSVEWETNLLYGWIYKNRKPDGSPYNLYRDGLRIHTTIHSKLQEFAEEAVREHLSADLQQAFFEEKEGREQAPFDEELEPEQIDHIMNTAVRRTERYRRHRNRGLSRDSIMEVFNTPVKMTVFSWEGDRDTVMTPMDSIRYFKHFLRAGFMSMEPSTGKVRAYVGGINFRYFKYDHVMVGARQVGSTIKPFLYTLAMQEGLSPCDRAPNVPQTFIEHDSVWTPRNSGSSAYEGKMVTLKWGLANSVNNISAWLVKRFNPQAVIDIIEKMGVESYIMPVNSVFLGTSDIKLSEMVGAFNTYANQGVYVEPLLVTRIEDRNGNVLSVFKPRQVEAISEESACLMIKLLQAVVDYPTGTGHRLRWKYEFKAPLGGKTGTTQNHSDGWFVGIAPKLVSGVWVGGEDRSIHFDGISLGQGANMALPIFALYMKKVYEKQPLGITPEDDFEEPEDFDVKVDCGAESKGTGEEFHREIIEF